MQFHAPFSSFAHRRWYVASVLISALSVPSLLSAQKQKAIPLRDLWPPDAITNEPFGQIVNVRQLGDGTLLVNDGGRRQVIALDVALRNRIVVLDSNTTTVGYGRNLASLIPFLGDSLLLVSRSGITVIDPSGRVIDWTPATKQIVLTNIQGQTIGIDRDGYFIYQAQVSTRPPAGSRPNANSATMTSGAAPAVNLGASTSALPPNTMMIVRADSKTRAVKKVATIRREPSGRLTMDRGPDGRMIAKTVLHPLATWDDFAILSDGTVAVVRTYDYHVDFFRPNGQVDTTAKLPFEWKSLSDRDRQAIIDSARNAQLRAEAAGVMTREREGAGVMAGVAAANASGINSGKAGEGFTVNVIRADSVAAGVVSARPKQPPPPSGVTALPFGIKAADLEYVPYTDLPTSYPPFREEALNVDLNDNLWIRTTATDPSGKGSVMYDVVNNRGVLVERVRVPAGKFVAGFGRDGFVYLKYEGANGWAVERTRLSI